MSMLCVTLVQQAVLLTISILFLEQSLSNEALKFQNYHIALLFINPLILILKQAYFILSLKKVRIWLESKTPAELKLKLKTYGVLRWFYSFLVILCFISLLLYIFKSTGEDGSKFAILNGAFLTLVIFANVILFLP